MAVRFHDGTHRQTTCGQPLCISLSKSVLQRGGTRGWFSLHAHYRRSKTASAPSFRRNDCFRRDSQRERILEIRFVATGAQISRSQFEKVIVGRLSRNEVPSAARAKQRNEAMVYRENSRRTLSITRPAWSTRRRARPASGGSRRPGHATRRAARKALKKTLKPERGR